MFLPPLFVLPVPSACVVGCSQFKSPEVIQFAPVSAFSRQNRPKKSVKAPQNLHCDP